jgi:hypothetical protein
VTIFGRVQILCVFFSSSLAKRAILTEDIFISLQSQSDTRWSYNVAAIRPIVKHLTKSFQVIGSRFDINDLDTAGENLQGMDTFYFFGLKCYPLKTKGMLLIRLDEVKMDLVENLTMKYKI